MQLDIKDVLRNASRNSVTESTFQLVSPIPRNDFAESNALRSDVTFDVSHELKSEVKELAPSNMACIDVTLEVSHELRSDVKPVDPWNM